jgi:hypothetical protein
VQPEQAQSGEGQPSEEELRAAYEAEMSRISATDMILQATVSLLNIGGYRLGLAPGAEQRTDQSRDLEQVRDAIDGARALLPVLERRGPEEMRPLREALSQLQMAYAREAGAAGSPAPAVSSAPGGAAPPADKPGASAADKPDTSGAEDKPSGPGPAESSGRLWVPGR